MARMAFNTASTITPTSAKIASHILTMPTMPNIRQMPFTPNAMTIFSLTMRRHFRDMRIALPIFVVSSSMSTTSAAYMATSLPIAPIAMPTSARDNTGASLMPSPTKAVLSVFVCELMIFSTCDTLSVGRSSPYTWSIPSAKAVCSATALVSPVSMTARVIHT